MLSSYITIAIRSLFKNRFFTLLNLTGLSIGLSAGLLILLWVKDEVSFDRFHPETERIYRENTNLKIADKMLVLERCPAPHAAYAVREIPEVEKAVRVVEAGAPLVRHGETGNVEKRGVYADSSFFQVFRTTLLAGNPDHPFGDINSVVVTESFARKYFGGSFSLESITGQVLQIDNEPVVVSAVLQDYPGNTVFQYDFIRPYTYLKAQFQPNALWKSREEDWGNCDDATYFKLREGANVADVEQKLTTLTHTHNKLDRGTFYTLQPLSQIHLYSADGTAEGAEMVRILSIVAIFILLIASINYVNLATAKAAKRAREVGLRKAIGAKRSQLAGQFLLESILVFLPAAGLALGLTCFLLPFCNTICEKNLQIDWNDPGIPLLIAAILGGTLLLSAVYPAVVLSAFNPLHVLKGQLETIKSTRPFLRKGLVVLQFACASALVLAMVIMAGQINFIQTKNLGYDRENVFQINLSEGTYDHRNAFIHDLENTPGVLDVTAASGNILQSRVSTGDIDWEGKENDNTFKISPIAVASDYLPFFNITLKSGSDFSGTPADATAFIINETAAAQMGLDDPIGKQIKLWETEGTIIGVVRDFHFESLRKSIQPAILYSNPQRQRVICIKTTGKDVSKTIAAAGAIWKKFDPAYPFEYTFMEESYDKMYRKEQQTAQLFKIFGAIALLISCLGLLGLSAFTVEQRTKEIGIRKVLGATAGGITMLLAKEFLILVLAAFLIAAPIAYWGMEKWLADFAYHIDIRWWMFTGVGVLALAIALLTVGFQSMKAALMNPVKTLRSE